MKRIIVGSAAALLAMSMAAGAADLGGNCCADLEERVAELEAVTVKKGNRKVSVTISGWVSKGVLWVDKEARILDNFNAPSRFAVVGDARISPDLRAGFVMELGISDADSAAIAGGSAISVRHSAVWLESKAFGRATIGQTDSAAKSIVELNIANVNVAALPLAAWMPVNGARTEVVKYTSPSILGFELSASMQDKASAWATGSFDGGETYDVAIRYASEFDKLFRVAAGAAFSSGVFVPAGTYGTVKTYSGSASVMHLPTGLFVTGQYGKADVNGTSQVYGGNFGIERNIFGIGPTTIFGEYAKAENMPITIGPLGLDLLTAGIGVDVEMYGLGIVQAINSAAMEVFASYRNVDVGAKADVVMVGTRIKL